MQQPKFKFGEEVQLENGHTFEVIGVQFKADWSNKTRGDYIYFDGRVSHEENKLRHPRKEVRVIKSNIFDGIWKEAFTDENTKEIQKAKSFIKTILVNNGLVTND